MNLTIKKVEELLSKHLKDPIWLVKKNNIYIVQRISDGNFEKYKNLRFNKLSDVLDFIEEREEWKKKIYGN